MREKFIDIALKEAKKAFKKGEVPVGAVIVRNNKVIAKAHNLVESKKNAIMHAEVLAISKASKKIKNWRLSECDMYVTLEPCGMCKNAIELSRINKVYFCLKKDKIISVSNYKYEFIEKNSSRALMLIQDFFKKRR